MNEEKPVYRSAEDALDAKFVGKSNPLTQFRREMVKQILFAGFFAFALGGLFTSTSRGSSLDWVDWLFLILAPICVTIGVTGLIRKLDTFIARIGRTASMMPRKCFLNAPHDWHVVVRNDGTDWYCLGRTKDEVSRGDASSAE